MTGKNKTMKTTDNRRVNMNKSDIRPSERILVTAAQLKKWGIDPVDWNPPKPILVYSDVTAFGDDHKTFMQAGYE